MADQEAYSENIPISLSMMHVHVSLYVHDVRVCRRYRFWTADNEKR